MDQMGKRLDNHGYYFALLALLIVLSFVFQFVILVLPTITEVKLTAFIIGFAATFVASGLITAKRSTWILGIMLALLIGGTAGATIAFNALGYFGSFGAAFQLALGFIAGLLSQRILYFGSKVTNGKLQTFLLTFSEL